MHFIMQTLNYLSFQCGLDCGVSDFVALGLYRGATECANVFAQVQHLMAQPGSGLGGRVGHSVPCVCLASLAVTVLLSVPFTAYVVAKTAFDL